MDFYRSRSKWKKKFLCQGDILTGVPVVRVPENLFLLAGPEDEELRPGISVDVVDPAEVERAFERMEWIAATARKTHAIILSQTCDIDHREFVVVSPLFPMDVVEANNPDVARATRNGDVYHRFHVPPIPDPAKPGDYLTDETFADLTFIYSLPEQMIRLEDRVASLSPWGYRLFVGALNCYFTRPLKEDEEQVVDAG